jgi:hypothetical protein
MNITIYLGSWLVPLVITIIALIAGGSIAAWDSKGSSGPYSFPIIGMMAVLGAVLISITAWAVFIALKILG